MSLRHAVSGSVASLVVSFTFLGRAAAEDAQGFIQQQHEHLEQLLHEPASSARDGHVRTVLGTFVGYDELTHRAFGEPCPTAEPSCEDLWAAYTSEQRAEVRGLLEQLVRKTYERNLLKTLDYEVLYRGSRESSGDTTSATPPMIA